MYTSTRDLYLLINILQHHHLFNRTSKSKAKRAKPPFAASGLEWQYSAVAVVCACLKPHP